MGVRVDQIQAEREGPSPLHFGLIGRGVVRLCCLCRPSRGLLRVVSGQDDARYKI